MDSNKQMKEQELLEQIGDMLENIDTYCRGERLEIPSWDVSIRLEIAQLSDRNAVLNYYLDSPQWDRELFECCAGIGQDQQQAIGMAQGSFLFGILNGIGTMAEDEPFDEIETVFDGVSHKWDVFQSYLVGMGESPKDSDANKIWTLLQDGIKKRVGGQKLCYVKVYCAKNGEDITGECRINDVPIPELSDILSEYAEKWDTKDFGSQKQFFFLRQLDETYVPYPYTEEDIADAVHIAVQLYQKCLKDPDDSRYRALLTEQLNDQSLAEEIRNFLPEMCAENAFQAIQSMECIGIFRGERQTDVYKTQLASYYWINKALQEEFQRSFPNELFSAFVSVSSMYGAVCKAKEKGADLTKGGRMFISYGFSENYCLR